jgi:signal transduction histidine kinase/CheY-like chemotaxis protein
LELNLYSDEADFYNIRLLLSKNNKIKNLPVIFKDRDGIKKNTLFNAEIIQIGGYKYIISIINDITEHITLTSDIKKAKEDAENAFKLKSIFLASMSHEIRSPMNAIIGFSNLLLQKDLPTSDKIDYVNIINNNGNKLLRLIDDILDFSKLESDQLSLDIGPVKLNKLLFDLFIVYEQEKTKLNKENLFIKLNIIKDKDIIINTDGDRLKQILNNLLDNALKFTDEGVIEFGYDIINNDELTIYVKDTGRGISKKDQLYLFSPFKQIASGKKYRGVGLGLSIAKKLANILNFSTIKINSNLGSGSKFYFDVKYMAVDGDIEDNSTITNSLSECIPNLTNKTVLIIDDDKDSYELLKLLLKETNANIISSYTGKNILNVLKNYRVDLILCDIHLPYKDGYQIVKEAKAYDSNIKLIAVTAITMDNEKDKALQNGFDEYISKPFSFEELYVKIAGVIKI